MRINNFYPPISHSSTPAIIDEASRDQMRRDREVALLQVQGRNLGYGLQGNALSAGVCVAGSGTERDFLSCGLVVSDGISNCQAFAPLSEVEALIAARFQSACCLVPNFQEVQHVPQNQGYIYILSQERGIQSLPYRMLPQTSAQKLQVQDFHYFVVIDFEATCDTGTSLTPQEIIEFPAVLVNGITGRYEGHFQTYVKPNYHPVLTDFCKDLTGIRQSQVDGGVSLSEALLMHDTWLDERGIKNTNFVVVTWSDWDCKVMLESECNLKGIRKPPYFNRWINLKVPFYGEFGELRCNLRGAVQAAGLEWEGRAHCGLDDAKNTARLLVDLMRRGVKLSITNSFDMYASDGLKLSLPKLNRPKSFAPGQFGSQPSSTKILGTGPISTTTVKDKDVGTLCFCGVRSNKCMVKKPGPRHGSIFFACGNWTTTRGAMCEYFEWAAPDMPLNA